MNQPLALVPLAAATAIALLAATPARPPAPPLYSIQGLGALAGGGRLRVNNRGHVIGVAVSTRGIHHAFLADGDKLTDLTPDSPPSSPGGINDSGEVVVSVGAETGGPASPGILLCGGRAPSPAALFPRPRPVGRPGRAGECDPEMLREDRGRDVCGINGARQIVGTARFRRGRLPHAFLWQQGGVIDLGALGGGGSGALDLNGAGQVVGYAQTSGSDHHAFLYSEGRMEDLGTLGGSYSCAYAVNESGLVVGEAQDSRLRANHAFCAGNGRMQDLGALDAGTGSSCAYGVNGFAEVVGEASTCDGQHAFLWDPEHGMLDLNRLIPARSGWKLQQASAINDRGQIAGWGTRGGEARAFLLAPCASPAPRKRISSAPGF